MRNRDESALKKLDLCFGQNGQPFDLRTVKFPIRSQKQPKMFACGGLYSFLSAKICSIVLWWKNAARRAANFFGSKKLDLREKVQNKHCSWQKLCPHPRVMDPIRMSWQMWNIFSDRIEVWEPVKTPFEHYRVNPLDAYNGILDNTLQGRWREALIPIRKPWNPNVRPSVRPEKRWFLRRVQAYRTAVFIFYFFT